MLLMMLMAIWRRQSNVEVTLP